MGDDDREMSGGLARRGLQLRHLRMLAALNEFEQVSAAAAQLNMTQPAGSRLLAELEHILGASLYVRHPRGVALSEIGLRFAERAQRILSEIDVAERELVEMRAGARGSVRIGAVTGPALEIILPVLPEVQRAHPSIEVSIMVETSPVLLEQLVAGRLDFMLGRVLGGADPLLFDLEHVADEPIALMARVDHPLAVVGQRTLRDCVGYDWVVQDRLGLLSETVERAWTNAALPRPERIVRTTSLLMTLAIVRQSSAIAPVARSVVEFYRGDDPKNPQVCALEIPEDIRVSAYSMLTLKERALPPAAQIFFDAVRRRVAEMKQLGQLS